MSVEYELKYITYTFFMLKNERKEKHEEGRG
jgi:hypothetical protein